MITIFIALYEQVTLDDNIKDKVIYKAWKDSQSFASEDVKTKIGQKYTNRNTSLFIELKPPTLRSLPVVPSAPKIGSAGIGVENTVNRSKPALQTDPTKVTSKKVSFVGCQAGIDKNQNVQPVEKNTVISDTFVLQEDFNSIDRKSVV